MLMVKAGDTVDQMIEQAAAAPRSRATSSSTAATRTFRTRRGGRRTWPRRGSCTSARACPAARRARGNGPSIMPGGNPAAWPHVKEIFQSIAAKVEDGTPCCDWVGEDGAGHYVKMVHNGIEYGDMQLICEAYQLLKDGARPERRRAARGVRRVEQGRAGQLPDRHHRARSSPRRTRTDSRWSTRSWTPPDRRARASGRASARSTWACR